MGKNHAEMLGKFANEIFAFNTPRRCLAILLFTSISIPNIRCSMVRSGCGS